MLATAETSLELWKPS